MMNRTGVMHITDTLETGGAERVAINLANLLPRERYLPYLCTTRRDGALAEEVAADVERLRLNRRRRFDAGAFRRFVAFIKKRNVRILHAHGSSLYIAVAASLLPPYPVIVWHDHFGLPLEDRPARLNRLLMKRIDGVIAVSQKLAEWSRQCLGVAGERVWYIPNFVSQPPANQEALKLPGEAGGRIVCVANLRPQKDHLTLLGAMQLVVNQVPSSHLLIVGGGADKTYRASIEEEIERQGLRRNVTLMGERRDIAAILRGCDIGVLSSIAEGLPLALIEYGAAGLAVVSTRVGQCAEVLDEGRAGMLVAPSAPDELANALLQLLRQPERRAEMGKKIRRRVEQVYDAGSITEQVCRVYDSVLALQKERR